MKSETSKNPPHPLASGLPLGSHAGGAENRPDWANGLKQLYDSVVDEPLPDSFQDLLDKLDAKD